MEVHVLIYDLSGGMARQMSLGMLGFQLDAIYHTSILLNGLEYVYDGNIVAITPGTSHLGNPLDREPLGTTQLPMDVIETYLDSLRSVYTPEAYNLWRHNCNNFSNDFATFLVGKGIPDKIINMPAEVLESPLGRMLMPALDQQVRASKQQNGGGILGIQNGQQAGGSSAAAAPAFRVREVMNLGGLDALLAEARGSCAVVFFTSATCGPCRMLYPLYEELAEEVADKGLVIKADISIARDVAARYSITATPTFITFLKGEQENRWMGADASALRGNVRLLVQMAWLRHPHQSLRLPSLHKENPRPVLFAKVPPLPKLLAKMGPAGDDTAVQGVVKFIEARSKEGAAGAHLPDVAAFSAFVASSVESLSPDSLFPLVDMLRCGLVDPRLSGCFAEEADHKTISALLTHVNGLDSCPYPLRLVTLQAACNLFSSTLYWGPILSHAGLRSQVVRLVSSSFLDEAHTSVRVAAASVLFNVAVVNGAGRRGGGRPWPGPGPGDPLSDDDQVELAASVVEAISREGESREALEGMLLALGRLLYRLPPDSELADLVAALDAKGTVLAKKAKFKGMSLIDEIGSELLGNVTKGFKSPAQ
ncbi:hypothetical protein GGTG_00447 [Gaeumannomyces tritici R3-111a-1]|uniref:Thioredoxin n=1 Tax=Gaeumannomyces tritici (strain R3-111a-1) TaxID=644352 RepID=J3NGQ8_GAET3|nr:hypothetical protein GGTG_00447 [Gaeumannomyces tritici R3-111a-1]EJT80448.1 hypothetical protein GGTG_00447 [Gaeumannomyces tritici R3-111a-1]